MSLKSIIFFSNFAFLYFSTNSSTIFFISLSISYISKISEFAWQDLYMNILFFIEDVVVITPSLILSLIFFAVSLNSEVKFLFCGQLLNDSCCIYSYISSHFSNSKIFSSLSISSEICIYHLSSSISCFSFWFILFREFI